VFDAVFTDVGIQIVKIPANITEWWWAESPERRLVFRSDIPKTPRALPRYLSAELDRRLTRALQGWPDRLSADALSAATSFRAAHRRTVNLEGTASTRYPGKARG